MKTAANKPDSWWQISYNAACAYATCVQADPDRVVNAFGLLEQTVAHPGIHQLTANWVKLDPDLQSVRLSDPPRFERFAAQLRSGD